MIAIDLETETLIPLNEAPAHIPSRPHIASVYRWAGRRRNPLDTVRVGGRRFTSREAINRFIERCTANDASPGQPPSSLSTARERENQRIDRELAAAGI